MELKLTFSNSIPATALHLKEKAQAARRLQGASTRRRWRKWDTDSDSSDGSDDELDLAV